MLVENEIPDRLSEQNIVHMVRGLRWQYSVVAILSSCLYQYN